MANPTISTLTTDTWVLVASGVTTGTIHAFNDGILHTYRMAGGTAPTLKSEGIQLEGSVEIESSSPIDVYLYATIDGSRARIDA